MIQSPEETVRAPGTIRFSAPNLMEICEVTPRAGGLSKTPTDYFPVWRSRDREPCAGGGLSLSCHRAPACVSASTMIWGHKKSFERRIPGEERLEEYLFYNSTIQFRGEARMRTAARISLTLRPPRSLTFPPLDGFRFSRACIEIE